MICLCHNKLLSNEFDGGGTLDFDAVEAVFDGMIEVTFLGATVVDETKLVEGAQKSLIVWVVVGVVDGTTAATFFVGTAFVKVFSGTVALEVSLGWIIEVTTSLEDTAATSF